MAKNYQEAAQIGRSILNQDPTDIEIRQYLKIIQKKIVSDKLIKARSHSNHISVCHSSDSDEVDYETDESAQNSNSTSAAHFDTKKFCQSNNRPKPLSVYVKENLRQTVRGSDVKLSCNFKEKMYRVIPIRLNKK